MNKYTVTFALLGFVTSAFADDICITKVPIELRSVLATKFLGYRLALSTDQKLNDPEWDKLYYEKGVCTTVVSADFNGDGKPDYALYLTSEKSLKPRLVAALSTARGWAITELPQWSEKIAGCNVSIAEPGNYEHTITYEFVPDASKKHGEPREVERLTANRSSIWAGQIDAWGVVYSFNKSGWIYVLVRD